jgi:DNA-binding MarR family transcriptional regulator
MKLIQSGCTANATSMAMALGITKGAVSQTISRLVKKTILCKSNNVLNKNELIVSLTENGIAALKQFDKKMEHNSAEFDRYIESISSHDKKIIELFINKVESFVKNI